MKKQLLSILLLASAIMLPASAGDKDIDSTALSPPGSSARDGKEPLRGSLTAWKLSLGALAASQAFDAYSSHGLREENSLLANSSGSFGAKGDLLKLGITGALVGIEFVVIRVHPGAAKVLWKLNLASAAVTGGVAAHNMSLH